MKLKKIVSLALAGVLAVSMLTACGSNTTGNDGEDSTITTPASNASSVLYNELSKATRNLSSASSNAKLDDALKEAVDNYISDAEIAKLVNDAASSGSVKDVDLRYSSAANYIAKTLDAEVGTTSSILDDDNDKAKSVLYLYAFSYGVSDQLALEKVAGKIDGSLSVLPEASSDSKYEYDYTISASVATKTYPSTLTTQTVKFVAVVVTQTPTEV